MPHVSILTFRERGIPMKSLMHSNNPFRWTFQTQHASNYKHQYTGFWLQQFLVQIQNGGKLALETGSFFISPGTDKSCSKASRF